MRKMDAQISAENLVVGFAGRGLGDSAVGAAQAAADGGRLRAQLGDALGRNAILDHEEAVFAIEGRGLFRQGQAVVAGRAAVLRPARKGLGELGGEWSQLLRGRALPAWFACGQLKHFREFSGMAEPIKNISPINITRSAPGIVFGDVWYNPGGECGPRLQQDFQLVIVHLGEADVSFDDGRCMIPPGSVALMLPGRRELFRFSRKHRTHHTWCALSPVAVPRPLRKRLSGLPPVQPQSLAFELLMKAAFSIRAWRTREGGNMLRLLALALLEEYGRMAKAGPEAAERESPRERARYYLEEHCAEEDCLKGAARAAGITPQHLIRLFRQHYQITPGRYLWQTRVEQGAGLLAATGLTVSEIADRCGFKNPFHFSRLLRQMQGLSPRQLRQRAGVKAPAPFGPGRRITQLSCSSTCAET